MHCEVISYIYFTITLMETFEEVADKVTIYKIREAWLNISKLYNEIALNYNASISMAFILLATDQDEGTPVWSGPDRAGH